MARPPFKDRDQVLSKSFVLRVTKEERDKYRAAAAKQGLTLSAWVRLNADRAARTGI